MARILLAEDDVGIRMLFRYALQNAEFSVCEVEDGLEAIDAIKMEEFDAVVLDISMPRIDGVAAINILKMMRNGRRVPVIVVTALHDEEMRQRAFNAGASDYLEKPISPDEIVASVRRHLDQARDSMTAI